MNLDEKITFFKQPQFKHIINLSNHIFDLIFVLNKNLKITYLSNEIQKHLIYTPEELIQKDFLEFIDVQDKSEFINSINILDENNALIQRQLQIIDKDKNSIWFDSFIQYIYDTTENSSYYLILLRNILQKSYKQEDTTIINQLLDLINESIIIVNDIGKIVYSNYEATSLCGLTKNELEQLYIYDIDKQINSIEKWESFKNELTTQRSETEQIQFLKPNGEKLILELTWQLVELGNHNYYIQKRTTIADRIENELKIRKTLERQHLLSQIAYIVNTHESFDFKINEALRIIGNYLQVSRILIFQNILNGKAVNCTFEWHNLNLLPKRFDLQAIPYSLLTTINQSITNQQIAIFDGIDKITQDILPYFLPEQLYSIIIVPLNYNKKAEGFICFIDHQQTHNWKDREIRFVNTFVDIISSAFLHKYTIESLIKSERRFRELAELLPEMVCEAAINGKLTFANKHTQLQFGFTDNDLPKGILFFNFFHPSDRQRVMDNFEKLLTGINIQHEEYRIINREGLEIPVLLYMNIIMQDQLPAGLRTVMVDISERKKYEKHLEELASFAENSPFILLKIKKGELIYQNSKALDLSSELNKNFTLIRSHAEDAIRNSKPTSFNLIIQNRKYIFYCYPNSDHTNLYGISELNF